MGIVAINPATVVGAVVGGYLMIVATFYAAGTSAAKRRMARTQGTSRNSAANAIWAKRASAQAQAYIVVFLIVVAVFAMVGLEAQFNNNPTTEDLYFGGNSKAELVLRIGVPIIGGMVVWLIALGTRMRRLDRELLAQKQSDATAKAVRAANSTRQPSPSKATEIEKLHKLLESGAISDEEFGVLKGQIISDSNR